MAKAEPKRTRSQIVRGWFREEAFWRDVTTRTVAGLIVLAIGALAVALVGIVDIWVVLRVLFAMAAIFGSFVLFVLFANKVASPVVEAADRRRRDGEVAWPLGLAGIALILLGLAALGSFMTAVIWMVGLWGST